MWIGDVAVDRDVEVDVRSYCFAIDRRGWDKSKTPDEKGIEVD